jgi:type IV secretion system protein VirD4
VTPDFQERTGPTPAALVFALGVLLLLLPSYGYLLALRHLPAEVLRSSASFPTFPLPFVLLSAAYLAPRIRRGHLFVRLAPPLVASLLVPLLPPRLPSISPFAGLRIHAVYSEAGRALDLLPTLLIALATTAVIAFIPAAFLRRNPRSEIAPIAHGSARWASERDVRAVGLLQKADHGLHLGYFDAARQSPLTDSSDHHVLVLAPPGTGKTTALVIPTLLSYPAAAWILDPKGELWNTTARWRRESFGHRCIRFAPTDPGTPGWNPLLEIPTEPGSDDIATATTLAENLVVTPAHTSDLHWTRAARSLFTTLALHVRYASEVAPTMASVRGVLASHTDHDELFEELATFPHDPDASHGWTNPLTGEPSLTHPEVALQARKFRATPGRERGSIISTLQHFLDVWGDPQIAAATSQSDFSLDALLQPPCTSFYLSIPFHDLTRLAPLVRLQLAALARRLTRRPPESPHRLEVVVDEYASLGRLPVMEQLLAFLRGYNARCFLLLQDLAQLHRLYGMQESISGNCRVHLTTATQSIGTRRHASSLAGATTARYRRMSRSQEGGRLSARSRRSISMVESSRPLLTEGEVGALPLDHALVFKAGAPPIRARLRPYFEDPRLLLRTLSPLDSSASPPPS